MAQLQNLQLLHKLLTLLAPTTVMPMPSLLPLLLLLLLLLLRLLIQLLDEMLQP
jgi:hypothetical protein